MGMRYSEFGSGICGCLRVEDGAWSWKEFGEIGVPVFELDLISKPQKGFGLG
jgi:hypothetical protein